jgi:alanine racemase
LSFSSPIRLRLDGGALAENWSTLARLSGNAATGAAVKANGYGLGAREVAARLWKAGCRDFFVAHWAEAEAIADIIPAERIAVLNGAGAADIAAAIDLGAIPVLNTPAQLAAWRQARGGRCHVMLDSGINRLGIGPEQIKADLLDGLNIDILMSHLASADEDSSQNPAQLARFKEMAVGLPCKRQSFANSAGIILGSDYHFDLTRPGVALYGGIARAELAGLIRPVVGIEARVLQLRCLQVGDAIGYNATHKCNAPTRVATIAMGYADGYWRGFSSKGRVRAGEHWLPVLGRVSMDLVTIDASAVPHLAEGDWVAVDFDLTAASAVTGKSPYELLTGLGQRAERIWA